MKTNSKPFSVVTRREVPAQVIADTLVSAFEGGSNYWASVDNVKGPSYRASTCDRIVSGSAFVYVVDRDNRKTYKLNRRAVARGLRLMAQEHPTHFNEMTGEDKGGDATTGDVLLQLCLLGEVVYG